MAKNPVYEFDSEEEAIKVLQEEGRRLKYIAIKIWRQYLASYKPKQYAVHLGKGLGNRTRRSQRAIKLGKVKKHDGETLSIELTWQDDLAYHESVMGSDEPMGHSIMLISEGWKTKKGKSKNIYRFGYYEGFDYINKVIKAFEESKHQGISLELQWSGKFLK